MKSLYLAGMLCLGALAQGQQVNYNYDRATNFGAFKTYQWTDASQGRAANPLVEQSIRRAVDEQLAAKGLRLVESGADVKVAYQVSVAEEKQFTGFGTGPRWSGTGRVSTSTIEVGTLAVGVIDASTNKLVWTGQAQKTLDLKQDPDKNYKNLQKALLKLFKNYPPGPART